MSIKLNAQTRTDLGKGASRRLRHDAKVPAVVYGTGEPQSITLEHKDLWKAQEAEAFYSTVLKLSIDGTEKDVIIKDIQRHPAKSLVLHADFLALDEKTPVTLNIPIHFVNAEICHGVKMQGGSVQYLSKQVRVKCLPKDIPAFVTYDLAKAQTGEIIHISNLELPEGVVSIDLARGSSDYDLPLAQIIAGKKKG
jgi:large subunit ribosomal protein L25